MEVEGAVNAQLEKQGYALGRKGVWGGPQKTRYYRPDGIMVEAIPCMRERQDGLVYDWNISGKGWSLRPPLKPKPHCEGCGDWHDTKAQVLACKRERARKQVQWEAEMAERRNQKGSDKEKALEAKNEDLEARLKKLEELVSGKAV